MDENQSIDVYTQNRGDGVAEAITLWQPPVSLASEKFSEFVRNHMPACHRAVGEVTAMNDFGSCCSFSLMVS